MASFKDFLSTFSGDSNQKGNQFERFVKWFLINDPMWSTQVEQVWHWYEYPNRWSKDLGIDLVFKHKNGDLWAVQAKGYAETTSITKAQVDSFISAADSKTFAGRLLIGTTDSLGDNAKKVCDRQNVTRYLLADFESSSVEYPDSYDDLLQAPPSVPPKPREHQLEAIKAVKEGFKDTDRGQLIMACGTGKTFTTLWIKEALEAESTLILLPSLGLLSQTLHEWTKAASKPFEVLCVCSDDSVGKKSDDESYDSVAQLPFPVTSDPQRIQSFLELQKSKVVFSTYQSSPLVAEAQAANTGIEFDLIVADEAHRCAGVVGDGFSSVLNGQRLRGKKRLFATATPKTYSKQIKSAAEGRGIEVIGMDDEVVFGKPLYTLNFGEAIERKLLTDYRVVIVGVDDGMLASWIESRQIVRTDTGIQTDAKSLAAIVGLLKAIKDYDLHRLITFHSRVKGAEAFAKDILEVQEWLPQEMRLNGKLNSDYVSGEMPTDKRRQKLSHLKNVSDGEVALLSNSRCLSEGVDVPSLDGVAFIDPKNSQIDIIQAVGRAIRLSTNKTAGTIVLPVFIERGDTAEKVIERSDFKQIWGVLAALKAHDETFANELNQLRTEMGRKGERYEVEDFDKIVFDMPKTVEASFSSALRAELVIANTSSWDEWFGRLLKYVEEYGDLQVPVGFKTDDGLNLYTWVSRQRSAQDSLPVDKRKRLESLKGWTWNVLESQWEIGFEALKSYVHEHDNALVPATFKTADGYNLGNWVFTQRSAHDSLPVDKRKRLESLKGWRWNVLESQWEIGFEALERYVQEYGDTSVPKVFKTADGYNLGHWVLRQRRQEESISAIRKERLESLKGWTWKLEESAWESGFEALERYVQEHGDKLIHRRFKTADGRNLATWVSTQRYAKDSLPADRKKRLESLKGWTWDALESQWEIGFQALERYVQEHGDASAPKGFKTADGFNLGSWVRTQRKQKDSIPETRKERLEALKGWTWNLNDSVWEIGFEALQCYVQEHGHALVPRGFKTADGFHLGNWVANGRKKKDAMSADRQERLEALKGWTWNSNEFAWEVGFEALKSYVHEHDNALVPASFKTADGFKLGAWVTNQRSRYDLIPKKRRERLEVLKGWTWNVIESTWEIGFEALRNYIQEQGDGAVPTRYTTSGGFKLGSWVAYQRQAKDSMSADRKDRLEALECWIWSTRDD